MVKLDVEDLKFKPRGLQSNRKGPSPQDGTIPVSPGKCDHCGKERSKVRKGWHRPCLGMRQLSSRHELERVVENVDGECMNLYDSYASK